MSDEVLACLQRIEALLRDRLPPASNGKHPLARWAGCFTDDPDWAALHAENDAERQAGARRRPGRVPPGCQEA